MHAYWLFDCFLTALWIKKAKFFARYAREARVFLYTYIVYLIQCVAQEKTFFEIPLGTYSNWFKIRIQRSLAVLYTLLRRPQTLRNEKNPNMRKKVVFHMKILVFTFRFRFHESRLCGVRGGTGGNTDICGFFNYPQP